MGGNGQKLTDALWLAEVCIKPMIIQLDSDAAKPWVMCSAASQSSPCAGLAQAPKANVGP